MKYPSLLKHKTQHLPHSGLIPCKFIVNNLQKRHMPLNRGTRHQHHVLYKNRNSVFIKDLNTKP